MAGQSVKRLGGALSRRQFITRTGVGLGGLAVAGFLAPALTRAAEAPPRTAARSCILVYLLGGPPHLDTFDLKPSAPAEVRGPFQPIATSVTLSGRYQRRWNSASCSWFKARTVFSVPITGCAIGQMSEVTGS